MRVLLIALLAAISYAQTATFDPSSTLVSYWDEGSCGPRGDDAQADLSQCVNGAYVVYSEPFDGYTIKATVDGCNYYSFDVYACLEGADTCEIFYGQDIVSGTFSACCGHGMNVESDEECQAVCSSNPDCTAWVTTSPVSEEIICYMTSGPVAWEADSNRNGGLPCGASYVVLSSGTCESAGYYSISNVDQCLIALRDVTNNPDKEYEASMPEGGYLEFGEGRAYGCTLNTYHGGEGNGEFFPFAKGECGTTEYDCVCSTNPTNALFERNYGYGGCNDNEGRESGWLTEDRPYTTQECAEACEGYNFMTVARVDQNCKCADVCVDGFIHTSYRILNDQCYSPTTSNGGITTRTRYREAVVTRPNTCTSQSQTKTCSYGNWGSWSGTYTYLTCIAQDAPTALPTPSPTDAPTALPTPSPTGVRLCEVPEHYSTECGAILHGSVCEIKFICDPGMFADGVAQECTESGWAGPELDPNCRPRTCVLPSQQPESVQYGESPALTHCSSADCDDYILNDVQCGPDHEMSLTKCTVDRDLVTIECISCVEDDQGNCVPRSKIPTLKIFENFYYGIHIEDPFGTTKGYNIFEVAVEIPKAGVDKWQRDLIETFELTNPYVFLVEDQFSRTATGARGSVKSTTKSFKHYGEFVEHNSKELEIGVRLDNDLMAKAKEHAAKGSASKSKPKSKPMQYGSVGVAGSHSHNRQEGEKYSHLVQFSASQFIRKQVFGTWRFNPNHDNVKINPNLVSALMELQPYSNFTEFQYRSLFDLYGTHYASTFDLGYEINAAEFSSECESSEEKTLSTTRKDCFEASFQYKFTNVGGDGCITTTSDSSTEEEEFMSFETATFEVRGGRDAENSAFLDKIAEMKFDGSTKRTAEYDAWIESTYRNPGIVGFETHPIWNLVWTHPSLMDLFDNDHKTRLVNDMEKAFYAILHKKEDAYRVDWCNAECNCGVEVDPVSCSCKECFKTFVSEDCCVQSSIDLFTCKQNKADMAQFGFALFFALFSLVF